MKLRTTQVSPFGQKVLTAAKILGIADRIEVLDTNHQDENDLLRIENPLGKMPVLTTESGECIYDSRVIVEYLNDRFNGNLIPADPAEKFAVKVSEALSDGIIDAGVLIVLEHRMRPEAIVSESWLQYQRDKMLRGFARLRQLDLNPAQLNVANISAACLLRWMPVRKPVALGEHEAYFSDWLQRFDKALN